METMTYQRFRSGDICITPGWYEFDGYSDGVGGPAPEQSDERIALGVGDIFPLLQSSKRWCYWRVLGGTQPQETV